MPSSSNGGRRSRTQWQALIARAERSALSVAELCRREATSTASLYAWRHRLRAQGDSHPAPKAVGVHFIELDTLN